MTGIVKNWNRQRAFGLLMPLIGKPEEVELVFCHRNALLDGLSTLPDGVEVTFDLARADGGRVQAVNVRLKVQKIKSNVLLRHSPEQAATL
jgi:cold shock CspA family protein